MLLHVGLNVIIPILIILLLLTIMMIMIMMIMLIIIIIVSITKFSIVSGSSPAYFTRDRPAITLVSNYRCPIKTFCNSIPVVEYPRDFHDNYASFNGFLRNVF